MKSTPGQPAVLFFRPYSGWVDDKWPNPVTKDIAQESTYVEKYGKYVIGCGIYK
jgi:hypothetical protein